MQSCQGPFCIGVYILYEALYRKYRPKTFDDVVGQDHITGTLKNQVCTGRLSHAYLFIGTRGTGKTTCARILAKAVNCQHPENGNPCNRCPACLGIGDGSILDVVELDAASNNGVDDVRMLRDEAVFSPVTVRKRVYIIDEVHMLSKPAFNALLKILEEPPEHLMFILATTELNKVLPTILSRCQRHSFRRLDSSVIAERLSWVAGQEGIRLDPQAARLLGRLADGSMRDGLSLLDQCAASVAVDAEAVLQAVGLAGSLRTRKLADYVAARDGRKALELFQALWREGKDPPSLLEELAGLFRDALLLRLAPKNGEGLLSGAYGEDALSGLNLSQGELLNALNTVQRYLNGMRDSRNPRLQGELCLLELCLAGGPAVSTGSAPERGGTAVHPAPVSDRPEGEGTKAPAVSPPRREAAQAPVPPSPAESASREDDRPASVKREKELTAEQAVPDGPGSVSWDDILTRLESAVPTGAYMILSNDLQAVGEVTEGQLCLRVAPGFFMAAINKPEIMETIRACAAQAAGKPIPVRLEELRNTPGLREDKLGELGQFGNVTIR